MDASHQPPANGFVNPSQLMQPMVLHRPQPVVFIEQRSPQSASSTLTNDADKATGQGGKGSAEQLVKPGKSASARYRAPTLDEALPRTPLTSTVPFSVDVFSMPSAVPTKSPRIFTKSESQARARANLDRINATSFQSDTADRLEQQLNKVKALLRADDLTTYKFPTPKIPMARPKKTANGEANFKEPTLSSFASLVVKNVPFPHTCNLDKPKAKSVSTDRRVSQSTKVKKPTKPTQISHPKQPETTKQSQPAAQSEPVKVEHLELSSQSSQKARPVVYIPVTPLKTSRVEPKAEVETAETLLKEDRTAPAPVQVQSPPSTQSRAVNFSLTIPVARPELSSKVVADPVRDARLEALYESHSQDSRKRKRDADISSLNANQQEKAAEAIFSLEKLVDDVFDAVDSYSANPTEFSEYFVQGSLIQEDQSPVLSSNLQARIESAITKTISAGVFDQLTLPDLMRLQRICDGTVSSVCDLSLIFVGGASEGDEEEWLQGINIAATAMKAGRILLRTMTAERIEKEIYSEDYLDSVLRSLTHVIDRCLVPVIEERLTGSNFKSFARHKKSLSDLMALCGRVLRMLGDLVAKVNFAETSISKVEDLAIRLIFIENASAEKDAVLGIQKFEALRRAAMDTIAEIFARHPKQHQSIINEVLMSLEKLPSTRQNARQYKIGDVKPVQLVSALLMRLIQATSVYTEQLVTAKRKKHRDADSDTEGTSADDEDVEMDLEPQKRNLMPIDMDKLPGFTLETAAAELSAIATHLYDSAARNATYIINYLVGRALSSTKTGDQPYRVLLDIFVEDFLTFLELPEWPAAELFLRIMLNQMIGLFYDEKRPVPHRNMALDHITLMGSRITDTQLHARNMSRELEADSSDLSKTLNVLIRQYQDVGLQEADLILPKGPYRIVFENLLRRHGDAQANSARALVLIQWAKACLNNAVADDDMVMVMPQTLLQLRNTIPDHLWSSREYDFPAVDQQHLRTAFSLLIAASPFCAAQGHIMNCLTKAIESPHSHLKSKGLKSVPLFLEKDPTLLDRHPIIVQHIVKCCNDSSSLVRQSALGLLEKCMEAKPSFEESACSRIISLSVDENVGVRKRAMKMLKDIYLRNDGQEIRSMISAAILKRVKDIDESIVAFARQTLEELWIIPFHNMILSSDDTKARLALEKQTKLIVRTLQKGENVLQITEDLLLVAVANTHKDAALNANVCRQMISIMFDMIIDNDGGPDSPSQLQTARALTVYAKSTPKLFTTAQMKLLEPYVRNLLDKDSIMLYRAACIIYRHVLPTLSSVEHSFLQEIRSAITSAIVKIPRPDLPDSAACVWNIANTLKDWESIVRLLRSVLLKLINYRSIKDIAQLDNKLERYIDISAALGAISDLDRFADEFRRVIPAWKGTSVTGLIIDQTCPFTRQKMPADIREAALRSVAMICQAWPQHYLRQDVGTAFELVFHNDNEEQQTIVLDGFLQFFQQEEKRSETGADYKVGGGSAHGGDRLTKTYVASDSDGAVTTIAQKFLKQILRIALSRTDQLALVAVQVTASINRQGLVHPKECGPALVALETSTNAHVAMIAFEAHQTLHQKHESMFDKEYMNAIAQAFTYQKDVLADPRGIRLNPYTAKLQPLFDVLKSGSIKVRKRFLVNFVSRVAFELPKLDAGVVGAGTPDAVLFARFVLENLAFFDYPRLDELMQLVASLEKMVVAGVGATVAHAIESEILRLELPADDTAEAAKVTTGSTEGGALNDVKMDDVENMVTPLKTESPVKKSIETAPQGPPAVERTWQLTVAAMILTLVWETRTHLRLIWGLQKSKAKPSAKDINKAPTRMPFASSEKFVDRVALTMQTLESPESQLALCRKFADLLAVDHELKIEEDDDDAAEAGYETPGENDERATSASVAGSASKGRKRKVGSLGPDAKKRQRKGTPSGRPRGRPRKMSRGVSADDDESEMAWD